MLNKGVCIMLDGIFFQSVMWRLKNENLKQLVRVLLDLFVKLWFLRVIADKGGCLHEKTRTGASFILG